MWKYFVQINSLIIKFIFMYATYTVTLDSFYLESIAELCKISNEVVKFK